MKVRFGTGPKPRTPEKVECLRRRSMVRRKGIYNYANMRLFALCKSLPDEEIREAVLRSLPSSNQKLHKCVRRLARALKAIDRGASPDSFRPVVEAWANVASLRDQTGLWNQFVRAYEEADGKKPRSFADPIRARIREEGLEGEAAVCRAMQLLARRFGTRLYVSARVMEDCTGISKSACATWFNRLANRAVIRVVEKGVASPFNRVATVFDLSPLLALCGGPGRSTDAVAQSAAPLDEASRLPPLPPKDVNQEVRKHLGISCVQPLESTGKQPFDDQVGRAEESPGSPKLVDPW